MRIYVSAQAWRDGNGTKERPFKHIQDAASIAQPGDEVLVGPGIYREYVDPANAGTPEAPITYRSVEPLGAVITAPRKSNLGNPMRATFGKLTFPIPCLARTTPIRLMYTATGISPAGASTPAAYT